jgi:molybdopterin adenylyltransferase
LKSAVLTISDSCHAGERVDGSGPAVVEFLKTKGWEVVHTEILPDERDAILHALEGLVFDSPAMVILTTGGTGVAPRDVTPEATRRVIAREIPGLSELMRAEGMRKTRRAALSRGVVGIAQEKVIVNLPGSPRAAVESLEAVFDLLPHVVELASGRRVDHG